MGNTILILMHLVPVLLGMFAGAAGAGQGAGDRHLPVRLDAGLRPRARWTIAKLALLAVAIAVLAWAFSQLFAWFFEPFLHTRT